MSVKVEMKMYLVNMFTICYEMLRVVERSEFCDKEGKRQRNSLALKVNGNIYNSLHSIARLPKDINPANTNRICSYIIVGEES
jgi:hypothetical protein